jgi:hypothetical protein
MKTAPPEDMFAISHHQYTNTVKQSPPTELHERWSEVKRQLRLQYPQLTEDDLRFEEGTEEELYQRIAERIGSTHQDIRDEVEAWLEADVWKQESSSE